MPIVLTEATRTLGAGSITRVLKTPPFHFQGWFHFEWGSLFEIRCYVELTILRELAGGHLSVLTGMKLPSSELGRRTKLRLDYRWLAMRLFAANT